MDPREALLRRLSQSMPTTSNNNGEEGIVERKLNNEWIAPSFAKNGSELTDLDGSKVTAKYRAGDDGLPYQKMTPRQAEKFAAELKMPAPFEVNGLWFSSFILMPAHARWLLENFCEHNRSLVYSQLADLKNEAETGNWFLLHGGFAFAGRQLKDGQHRSVALSETDVAVPIVVCLNLLPEAPQGMDQHKKRSAKDVGQIAGKPISAAEAATVRSLIRTSPALIVKYGSSAPAIVRLLNNNESTYVAFVEEHMRFKLKGVTNGDVKSAIVKIYMEVKNDKKLVEKVTRFMEILKTGMPEGQHESAAIKLRDKLWGSEVRSGTDKSILTQKALRLFLEGTPCDRLFINKMDRAAYKASLAKKEENNKPEA